jgi:hypothetical protein
VSGRAITRSVIPVSVVSLYEFEDHSDTSEVIDSEGSNNLNLFFASSYASNAAVGSLSFDHDGSGKGAESQNTIDLCAQGDTDGFGLAGWLKPANDSGTEYAAGWAVDSDNWLYMRLNGSFTAYLQVGGTDIIADSNVSIDTTTHTHVYCEATQSVVTIYVDNTEEASQSHNQDITTMGRGTYYTGTNAPVSNTPYEGLVDDLAPANNPLSDSALQTLYDRGN